MNKATFVEENERKYTISCCAKKGMWDKEHIVYQWFTKKTLDSSTKIKIVFSLKDNRLIMAQVKKSRVTGNICNKEIKYLTKHDFDFDMLIGCPFISKRRAIKGNIYLDRFLRSNNCCKYLLEIENETSLSDIEDLGITIVEDVTFNSEFENVNMAIPFEEYDMKNVQFLLDLIPGFE